MKLSRIDYIGLNGGDGEHYDMDILDRLKAHPKVNGAYLKDIQDAIAEIEMLRTVPMKYRRMEYNAQLQTENEYLRNQVDYLQGLLDGHDL